MLICLAVDSTTIVVMVKVLLIGIHSPIENFIIRYNVRILVFVIGTKWIVNYQLALSTKNKI